MFKMDKKKVKIVLLENINPLAVKACEEEGFTNVHHISSALDGEELYEAIRDAHVLGIRSRTHITKEVLEKCRKLLMVGCFCIGTNQVDLNEAMARGIPVFNDPHSNTRSVAELVIAFSIALMRGLFPKNKAAHAGEWLKVATGAHEVRGKTLGIVGYGRIGSQVSILAESLGMQVQYFDPEKKLSIGNATPAVSMEQLLATSDIVTLHVPETPGTKNLINGERLKLMKKDAFLINTSRGSVVDTEALAEALNKKALAGAAADVFPKEPSDKSQEFIDPLRNIENVILTPHIGGATEEAQENIGAAVTQKLLECLTYGVTKGATNFPQIAMPRHKEAHRILHVHQNIPGTLAKINHIFEQKEINIVSQYLETYKSVGYVVFDIQKGANQSLINALKEVEGTIRARILS